MIPQIHCKHDALVKPKSLKEHPKNRNKHPKEQVTRLTKMLKYYGFRHPIIVDADDMKTIIVGRGRQMSAIEAGFEHVPVVYQKFESEDQKYAFIQADNAISEWSKLDLASINMDIGELGPDFDIELMGLKDFTLDVAEKYDSAEMNACGDSPAEPVTKLGDLYQLGNHRLLCGDSQNIQHADKLMNGVVAEMVFTDPPYGVSFQSNMRTKTKKFDVIENDDQFIKEWIGVLPAISTGWVFVWTSWKVLREWIDICAPIGTLSNLIIWDKGGGGIGDLKKTFASDYEVALVYNRGAEITGKRLGSVWSIGKDGATKYLHPTQKPVELPVMAIENCTKPGDSVVDLFGGSGSTLIACETTGRKCYTMELDPAYCDVIVNRWEKLTGQKAVLLNGPKSD